MDWPVSTRPLLVISPRGQVRDGGKLGPTVLDVDNPLCGSSIYGNIAVSMYGLGTVDGMNEKGLSAHALYLRATELPAPDANLPKLQIGL